MPIVPVVQMVLDKLVVGACGAGASVFVAFSRHVGRKAEKGRSSLEAGALVQPALRGPLVQPGLDTQQ